MANSSFFKDGGADSGTFASLDSKLAAAEASKVAAEAAQVAAEQAETDAQTAEANTASDASDANASRISASLSALSAGFSETDAKAFAVNPVDQSFTTDLGNSGPFFSSLHYSQKAEDSKDLAAASETAAFNSATAAAASATSAADSLDDLDDSVTEAADSATLAAASATASSVSAVASSDSAADALLHKMNAAISVTNAASYEGLTLAHVGTAEEHRDDAAKLATEPEDSEYTLEDGTTGYSALHYAAEAESYSVSSETFSLNAQTSKNNAQNSQNAALASEGNAVAAQAGAVSAKAGAEAARDATLAALDSFDDRYLGVKSSDPTADNDGDALQAGQLYFNSTNTAMRVYDGSNWLNAYSSLSGALIASNNLSDLDNANTARTNLGLASVAASGTYSDLTGTPTTVSGYGITDAFDGAYSSLTGTPNLSSYITNPHTGDFTVDSGTLFVDASTNRVGINLGSGVNPTVQLNVAGTVRFQSTASAGQMLEFTSSSGVSKLYRANGHLELQAGNTGKPILQLSNAGGFTWDGNAIWHGGNDGSGSGLDADTVDGIQASSFLRSDANDTSTGTLTLNTGSNQIYLGSDGAIEITRAAGSAYIDFKDSTTEDHDVRLQVSGSGFTVNGNTLWHGGNDGSGSGLDADLLDGQNSSYYTPTKYHAVDDETIFAITDYDTTETLKAKFFTTNSKFTKVDDSTAPASGVFKVSGYVSILWGEYIPMDDETEIMFECWVKHVSGSDTSGNFYAGGEFYNGSKSSYGNVNRYWGANGDTQDSDTPSPARWRHIKGVMKGSTIRASSNTSDAQYVRLLTLFNYNASGNASHFCGFRFYRSKKTISSLWLRTHNGSLNNDSAFQNLESSSALNIINNTGVINAHSDIYLADQVIHMGDTDTYMQFHAADQWRVVTGGTERLEVSNGTTLISNTLDMNNGNITNVNGLYIADPGPGEGIKWNGGNQWQIYESPDNLSTNSAGNLQFTSGTGVGSMRMRVDTSGNFTASGNVTAYSDERLKDNIETLDGSKVYEMRGVSFTKDGQAGSGVIAQELQKVAPELVKEGDEYLSVAYGNVVGYLIEAIKELKAEIEELKKG